MISVPYSIELNDVTLFAGRNLSGSDFVQIIKDQYDQLSSDSSASGRVMGVGLHPFIINQPFRHKYLELSLEYIASRPDVWLTTTDARSPLISKTPSFLVRDGHERRRRTSSVPCDQELLPRPSN